MNPTSEEALSFFGDDEVKVPLSFDCSLVVLDDGLPLFAEVFLLLRVPSVGIEEVLVQRPFNDPSPSTDIFFADGKYGTVRLEKVRAGCGQCFV